MTRNEMLKKMYELSNAVTAEDEYARFMAIRNGEKNAYEKLMDMADEWNSSRYGEEIEIADIFGDDDEVIGIAVDDECFKYTE